MITASVLSEAALRMSAVVGEENVLASAEGLAGRGDPYPLGDPGAFAASAVVLPGSVDEVRGIVRIAAELDVPLWPVSRGKNNGYGGGAPRVAGSIVVELSRMDRILEVDERLGYAIIEPGVTFLQLYAHLRERGLRLWTSVPGLGWGSVIGNALDRGLGSTPYGDHPDRLCGLEVVTAEGELVRTGMGAMPQSRTWPLYNDGFGPAIDGLFEQSGLGIVTKAGIHLMPTPEVFVACSLLTDRDEDLGPLVDIVRQLQLDRVIESQVDFGDTLSRAALFHHRTRWYDGPGATPPEQVARIRKDLDLRTWTAVFGLYGPRAIVNARLDVIREALAAIPGVELTTTEYAGDASADEISRAHYLLAGIPNMDIVDCVQWRGGVGGHLAFSPVAPLTGEDAVRVVSLVRRYAAEFGFDVVGGLTAHGRYLRNVFLLIFDTTDPAQTDAARALFTTLVKEAGDLGYVEYRAHLEFMDLIADQFSYNNHSLGRLLQSLRDAVDPRGILSPGKQGLWPRRYRSHLQR